AEPLRRIAIGWTRTERRAAEDADPPHPPSALIPRATPRTRRRASRGTPPPPAPRGGPTSPAAPRSQARRPAYAHGRARGRTGRSSRPPRRRRGAAARTRAVRPSRAAHLHRHKIHAPGLHVALTFDNAALRLHREGCRFRVPVVPEVLREDPEAVARLLRFAPVGVEDAEAEVGARGGHAQEDPVGTDTPVPVAEATDHRRRERRRQ